MFYKNGRLAQAGDRVFCLDEAYPSVGIVHSISNRLGGVNARLTPTTAVDQYIDLSKCLHIDDVTAAPNPDSTPK